MEKYSRNFNAAAAVPVVIFILYIYSESVELDLFVAQCSVPCCTHLIHRRHVSVLKRPRMTRLEWITVHSRERSRNYLAIAAAGDKLSS